MSREAMKQALEALESANGMLERADCSTGYCCCGSSVEGHTISDGHSPVDEGEYFQSKAIKASQEAITALRQALANEALDKMAENARELGLDYDAKPDERLMKTPDEPFCWCIETVDSADWCFAKTKEGVESNAVLMDDDCVKTEPFPLYTRPQPADEPVAWVNSSDVISSKVNRERGGHGDTHTWSETKNDYHKTPLYTRPQPAAQWVGLTDEDIALFDWESFKTKKDCSRAIEQALKEKNGL